MRKRYFLTVIMLGLFIVGWAQDDVEKKLSITTQLFLNEMKGEISFERDTKAEKQLGLKPIDVTWSHKGKNSGRIYAAPDTINGKAYIAAYLRLYDANSVSEVEAKGVILQSKFNNGLYTSLIPVDKINEVAAISNVKRINVSPLKKAFTNAARQKTNVDDVLTLSTDAISSGLSKKYDGSGVVLGVIDTGIDFAHIAFKDKNGNSRIKKAYVYNGSSAQEYSSITSSILTDDNSEDHGTHTSTTAGGSSVIISGSNVTVTDDHTNATYGGMAPGADLYLAGINGLSSTYLDNAVKKMCDYADQQGKPLVVSNSWGSQFGPHDGTGDEADVYNSLFGTSHPNRIALFASSNDGGKSKDGEGGGYHVSGTASSSNPLRSIVRSATYSNTDAGYYYYGIVANAWARSSSVSSMSCKIYVLDSSTGAVKTSVDVNPTTNGATVSGLSTYYSGTLYAVKNYISSDKTQILLFSNQGLTSKSTTTTTQNGETYYKSKYTLAVEFAPSSGSSVIDVWGGNYGYFTNHLSTSGYSWTAGTDDGCYSDESTIDNVIPIGAYVSKTNWTASSGTSYTMQSVYTMDDIAYFSSWGTASGGPAGKMIPWITAPGARLAAGVNHNHTTSVDDYSYYGDDYSSDLVVNNSSYPYAMMEGTSMATPTAAGIVALWLQASMDENAQHKNLTVNDVKNIMKETAITDNYTTTGANASHFGNGKIDALAGIQYILGASSGPAIRASETTVSMEGYATMEYTKTIGVTGVNLEGNITVSKSGSSTFTVDKTNITQTDGVVSADITVTWKPTAAGTQNGTITLSSTGAESVTISLTGTAQAATPTVISDKESLQFKTGLNSNDSQTISITGRFLTGNVTATLNDANGVFNVSPTTLTAAEVMGDNGATVTVTFSSANEGTFNCTLTLASAGAETVTINLSAEASDGGTASDAYLNIAKYETIDEAGWRTALVDKLYKYTEYKNDEVAWLTLPLYGAMVGAKYSTTSSTFGSGQPQKWIETNISTTSGNPYTGTTWDYMPTSTEPYYGSSTYFTSASARAIGNNGSSSTTARTVTFYVTNTTAVKLYSKYANVSNWNSNENYYNRLQIYECTENNDGSLTASSTATANKTFSTKNSNGSIEASGLSKSVIYKVVATVYRGYLYEIGFQTPIEVVKTPVIAATPLAIETSAPVGGTAAAQFTVSGTYLTGNVTATLNDQNGVFALDKTSITAAEAGAGATVTVTFTPHAAQTYNATVTLTSNGAESVTVNLTGMGQQPYIIAELETLTFDEIEAESTETMTFEVLAENLAEVVTVTLADESGVFSLDANNISIADAEEGKTITVTFAPQTAGTYTGTVTLSSANAESVVVNLNATARKKTPDYFDVTISGVGVTTLYLDFPVVIPYETYDPDLLGVYYMYDIVNNSTRYARLSQIIPANTGVVIHGNSGTYRFPKATGTIPELTRTNLLRGVTEATKTTKILEDAQSSGVILTLGRGSNSYIGFYRFTGKTIPANKAFLIYESDNQNVKGFDINFDDVLTEIQSLNAEDDHSAWFTLQGVRLNGKPTRPGMYIKNNKVVTIKK